MSKENYRLYAFVANHYLSPLQCGLQTAHVVGNISIDYPVSSREAEVYEKWAEADKTIIICGAGNHKGVVDCFAELGRTGTKALGLPAAIFYEDLQSMNGMATACGIIVPEKYYNAQFFEEANTYDQHGKLVKHVDAYWEYWDDASQSALRYFLSYPEGQFINHLKSFRLA